MFAILKHAAFRTLFAAQIVALVGTGLATVALALLAYNLAGDQAGAVLGTALAIKMVVYVVLAPVSGALVPPAWRKRVLVVLDLVRAAVACALPFVTELWQVYLLIALLQSASAGFTPLFQSLIPEILPDERDYTRALSLSRLAYDLESLLSPVLAAALLVVISFHGLFAGTAVGFMVSAMFVLGTRFPAGAADRPEGGPYARAMRGMRIYLFTPRLRALLALNLCAAAGGAMVFVNTVVIVRDMLGGAQSQVAWALAAFGAGSMLVALCLPRVLDHYTDRSVMFAAGVALSAILSVLAVLWFLAPWSVGWGSLLSAWFMFGAAYAGLVTPGGRLLRRSADAGDLPFLFVAQFSLSHACWLLAYPLAGWLGARLGLHVALAALALLAVVALALARWFWHATDRTAIVHSHDGLPADHPHLLQHAATGTTTHAHDYVIDELHLRWP